MKSMQGNQTIHIKWNKGNNYIITHGFASEYVEGGKIKVI